MKNYFDNLIDGQNFNIVRIFIYYFQWYVTVIKKGDGNREYFMGFVLSNNPSYYLYGHVGDNVSYSVGNWLRNVTHIIDELSKNSPKKVLIFVGGTGLYFDKLINGISYIPDVGPEIKTKSSELYQKHGIKYFLNVLEKFDQITFSTIDKNNPRRVLRAWEVFDASG